MRCGWRHGSGGSNSRAAMRSFLAIPVPEAQADPLLDVQHALEVGRSVPPENWHVTLAFLGNQPATDEAGNRARASSLTIAALHNRHP